MNLVALYQVKIVKDFNDFLLLENHWGALCQSSLDICPMVTQGWLVAWWKAFGHGLQMHIVTVWAGDVLVAAAPLAIEEKNWGLLRHKRLVNWVNLWVDRYVWLVDAKYPSALTSILDYLHHSADLWDELLLSRCPTDVSQYNTISEYFKNNQYDIQLQDDLQSPTLPIMNSEAELMESLSPSFRQSLKRKLRTVKKQNNIKMWIQEDSNCESIIAEISQNTWQHRQGTSMISTDVIRNFFHDVIIAAVKDNNLRVAVMAINNEPVAFEFNLKCRDSLYNLKLGYKEKFTQLSVGLVLKHFVLASLMSNKVSEPIVEYDLMGTSEAYKLNWTKQVRQHQTLRLLRPGLNNLPWRIKYQYKEWLRQKLPVIFNLLKLMKNSFIRKNR